MHANVTAKIKRRGRVCYPAAVSLVFILVCTFLGGCYNPSEIVEELRFARQRPNETDLIGRWVPTPDTVSDMRKNGGYAISKHELLLNADRTFSVINMPDWWISGESERGFESITGDWKISHHSGDGWEIELAVGTKIVNSLHIRNQHPPYLIHIGLGDPDEGHFMLFQRSNNP